MKRIDLLGIDYQNDFVLSNGALSVAGAEDDAKRVSKLIKRVGKKFNNIYMSLDSHQVFQIFHGAFWLDKNNEPAKPFTPISYQDVVDGVWRASKRHLQQWALDYTKELEAKGRYGLFIWPYHCLLYTPGWQIYKDIADALHAWELDNLRRVNFLVKGNNPLVEHYSIFQAEVQTGDQDTKLNRTIIDSIEQADEIVITGEALSHCVAWSAKDLLNNFSDKSYAQKVVFLTDSSSSVTGFEQQGRDFLDEAVKMGMRTSTSVDYLA